MSDIDTAAADSLKALDPKRPIREADIRPVVGRPDNCLSESWSLIGTRIEIMKLPVAALAADNCALLIWCTGPHITIGSHVPVLTAWSVRPSTVAFDWVKTNADGEGLHTGMGYWTRSNSEVCLLATKGSPLRLATDVHQIVMAPVGEHSAKPEEARQASKRRRYLAH